jgi:diguanylate cyclase (GGDEF)-like protein
MQEIVAETLRERADEALVALAFIDLDNFKQVNDFYSHAVGDALLRAVGALIRPSDTLARISGDEFLLLIDPLHQLDDLHAIVARVVDGLKQPSIEGLEVHPASVGVCPPAHGRSYEELRRSADNAMYRAKQDRKGSAQFFTAASEALTARMEMEQRLRLALRERRRHPAAAQGEPERGDAGGLRGPGARRASRWRADPAHGLHRAGQRAGPARPDHPHRAAGRWPRCRAARALRAGHPGQPEHRRRPAIAASWTP